MKILTVSITPGCAVDRLAEMVQKHNEHLDIEIMPFHPKRYSQEDLKLFEEKAKKVDLIDFQYWKNAVVLLEKFPWLKDKKKILTHHNPYNLHEQSWDMFDEIVVKNEEQKQELPNAKLIRHGVDMDFFEFNNKYPYKYQENEERERTIGMVAFRIEGKKGIKEVAETCHKLGFKFLLVGHISKPDYFKEIMKACPSMTFLEDVSDDELKEAYRNMDILVCNSIDGFETGTMPIIEAMSMGVPVLTRDIGLVPDLNNGENMCVRDGEKDDLEDLETKILEMTNNIEGLKEMRSNAWKSVRKHSDYRMAKEYATLYNSVLFPSRPLVSVITPTYNRKDQMIEIIKKLNSQTYPNIELIVCDDNSDDNTESEVKSMREQVKYPIKYINTEKNGYNLSMARNLGIIEADGEYLMFLDSRFVPDDNAITEFMSIVVSGKYWVFGNKGANKKSFVENFSVVKRQVIIEGGMFNERIDRYGGMSQEVRTRFQSQGVVTKYVEEAKASQILTAKKASTRRKDILKMKNLLWKINL